MCLIPQLPTKVSRLWKTFTSAPFYEPLFQTFGICERDESESACRDRSVGIATRYGLAGQGIESRLGVRFSSPVQTSHATHPATYTMDSGSSPGLKRPMRGVDHPLPSSAEVKERVELYLYSLYELSWPVQGWSLTSPSLLWIRKQSPWFSVTTCETLHTDVYKTMHLEHSYQN